MSTGGVLGCRNWTVGCAFVEAGVGRPSWKLSMALRHSLTVSIVEGVGGRGCVGRVGGINEVLGGGGRVIVSARCGLGKDKSVRRVREAIGDLVDVVAVDVLVVVVVCLLYTSPSPRDKRQSRMPSSA